MRIQPGGLDTPEVAVLLQQHLDEMALHSPPESIHALDLDRLRTPDLSFWSVWDDAAPGGSSLMGCGALRELTPTHGELKSMRTATAYLRRGVAAAVLDHLVEEAGRRGYQRLSLETGSAPAFTPARNLYSRNGFTECGPFGDYALDDFSVFMTREL